MIGQNTYIDNLVHIAHNVHIGDTALLQVMDLLEAQELVQRYDRGQY